jgi:DNA end-binding protein Ku
MSLVGNRKDRPRMARSFWKGSISFGLVTIPVSLVAAEARESEIDFHLIDKRTMSRVKEKRVSEATGEEVPWDDVVKGYEYTKGKYVVLQPEELEAAKGKATHTIDVVGVVCGDCIQRPFYNRPYYVLPEAPGRKPYALLREVLRKNGQVAVARVVIRTRQYLAALFPEGDALVLDLLRYADELADVGALDLPPSDVTQIGVTDKEIALAEQLVGALVEDWDPDQYSDQYRNDLLDLIKRKVEAGGVVTAPAPTEESTAEGQVIDITDLLRRSIEAAQQEKQQRRQHAPPGTRPKRAAGRRK